MNFGDFLHSKRWKLIQNYIYSWGASVVLIGALAKLEHHPIASVMLGVGLSIEAIIFFISAFEPMTELPDWKKIYPQLRTHELKDKELEQLNEIDEKYSNFFGGGGGPGGGEVSIKDIPKEQIDKLNESFRKIAEVAKGIQEISDATSATNTFVRNLNEASSSIGSVVQANEKVSAEMDKSVKEISASYSSAAANLKNSSEVASSSIEKTVVQLSSAYQETADGLKKSSTKAAEGIDGAINVLTESVKGSADNLKQANQKVTKDIELTSSTFANDVKAATADMTKTYQGLAASLSGGTKNFEKSTSDFAGKIEQLNSKMAEINRVYEQHLKGANKVEQVVNEYSKGVSEIGKLLNTSVEETRKFNTSTKEFNENIQALNKVYGNMLGALNVKK